MRRRAVEPVQVTVTCEHRTSSVTFSARPSEPGQDVFFGAVRALIYACPACAFDASHWVHDREAFVLPGEAGR